MNELFVKQNDLAYLQCAKNQLYREAESWNNVALYSTIAGAIIFPILAILFPENNEVYASLGGVFGLVAGIGIKNLSQKKQLQATKVQELFDKKLFQIEWNKSLAGPEPAGHLIEEAIKRNKKKKPSDFKKWYNDYHSLSPNLAALYCQMENLFWDNRQRKAYFRFLLFPSLIVLLAGVIYAITAQLPLASYALNILVPQLGLVIYLGTVAYNHFAASQALNRKFIEVHEVAQKAREKGDVSKAELREIQDFIFRSRSETAVTPSWFYEKYNNWAKMQETIDATAEKLNK